MIAGEEIIAAARYLFSLLSLASLTAQELVAASGASRRKWAYSGKCRCTAPTVNPGNVNRFPFLIALRRVLLVGYPSDAYRYFTVISIDGRS
jgi:hypothetical protein